MPTDLRETRSLESRPRLKATCIKLHDMALRLGPETKLPTMAELRKKFGVSTYTLNEAVRELERRQVLRSVNGVGIYVTPRKRMLTGNIGLIGSDSLHQQHTTYYSQLVRGMETATVKNGQHLLFLGTSLTWKASSCEKVDGILIAGIEQLPSVVKQLPVELPVVTALTSVEKVSNVIADDYQGAKLAVQYLLHNNHQRIACLMEKAPSLPRRRFAGYKDALTAAGIELDPGWCRLTPMVNGKAGQHYMGWGREQMQSWLQEDWWDTGCTAIFVQNESAAIGVMQVLQEEGIQVPQQVSVIGFDGTDLCDYVSPSLCAMQVPLTQIGAKAVEMLNHQIQNGPEEAQSIAFPLKVREGSSVAAAPVLERVALPS